MADFETGLRIDDRFRLDMELGRGAFGCVYKAQQLVLGRPMRDVALKLFHGDVIDEHNVEEQMNDALAINALLSHVNDWEIRQHFLTVFDLGLTREEQPRAFVAMELVRQGSLAKRMRDLGKFTLHGVLQYLEQLVRAMSFMHDREFVHSDLKPDNVLLFRHQGKDHVKIGDFGLAGRFRGFFAGGPQGGDFAYMAPELIRGVNTTYGADVFSLGVIAYEMLTGENPYATIGRTLTAEEREDESLMRDLRLKSRREPLRLRSADFVETSDNGQGRSLTVLVDIINRMLETDVDRRYESAKEVETDLCNLLGTRPVNSTGATSSEKPHTNGVDRHPTGREDSCDPQVTELTSRWESAVSVSNWNLAARTARELINSFPDRPDGYELKSRTLERQSAEAESNGSPVRLVTNQRSQAVRALQEGIRKCSAPDDQRRLNLQRANLVRLMGDDQLADAILAEA